MAAQRAILVGAGKMGQNWAKNLAKNQDVQLVAWVDIVPGAAAEQVDKLSLTGVKAFDDLARATAESSADCLIDVTIPEAHHDVTLAGLRAGLHVLGEKPMADSMDRARSMLKASEKAGKLYMVSQSRRYNAMAVAFRQAVEKIGPAGILTSDFFLGPHFGGFRDQMAHVLLLDMAIHTFDSARQYTGADPISVYCEEFNPAWSWYKGDCSATAIFEMTGGLRFTYNGSWCAQGRQTSWDAEWRAFGPGGSANWDGQSSPTLSIPTEPQGFIHPSAESTCTEEADMAEGIAGSLKEFLWAIQTGNTPQGECHDNIKSLAMAFAAVESAKSGRRVMIDLG